MTVQAYVLIQTEVGKAAQVASEVRKIDGVKSADDVTGPYDVIVNAEADSVDELGKMVVSRVLPRRQPVVDPHGSRGRPARRARRSWRSSARATSRSSSSG